MPIRRLGPSKTKMNSAPCGGIEKKADTLLKEGGKFIMYGKQLFPYQMETVL